MIVRVFLMAAVAVSIAGCANTATEDNAVANPAAYYETLQSYVAVRVVYPPPAIRASEQGVCRVRTSFFRNGKIIETKLAASAGFEDLDRECIAVFERIATLPPAPESLAPSSDRFTVDIPVTFALK